MASINTLTIAGIILIVSGIFQLLFPPKFNASLFGLKTKLTMKNDDTWFYGQKVFNLFLIFFGLVIIITSAWSYTKTIKILAPFGFLVFWLISKYLTDQLISKKYQEPL